ncbi:endonuclease/exonuclease/phosphatase family protein [Pseudomonas sp. RTB3]|nr:endonuclease/exonuclease/phosphatase family protein [Pseudomonas sp. RTB3]
MRRRPGSAGSGDDAPCPRRADVRNLQLAYVRELIGNYKHQVLMGDMNTHANDLLLNSPLRDLGLLAPQVEATFPSWRPQRCLDHILLSPTLTLESVQVLAQPISDHLPVAVEIRLPGSLTVDALPALSTSPRGPLA